MRRLNRSEVNIDPLLREEGVLSLKKKSWRLSACATALLITACAASRPNVRTPVEQVAREARFAVEVSADSAAQYVRELVSFGPRMGGTPSGDRSAEYLRRRFENWGLVTNVVVDPEKQVHWEDGWRIDLVAPDSLSLTSAWPYGFSPSLADTSIELVFAPELSQLSTAHAILRGKAIYTHDRPRSLYPTLAVAGVVAVITDAPNREGYYEDAALIGRLPAGSRNALPVFAISRGDGKTLQRLLRQEANVRLRLSLQSHIGTGRPKTVIADIPGVDTTRSFIYSAHGDADSGGPGADDNASGVATVLETARAFSRLIRAGVLPKPRYTLRFIVWGSENFSASEYVRRHQDELDRILGVLNFDETGTGTVRQAVYFESNEVPWNATLLRTLDQIGRDYYRKPGFWKEYTTNPSQGGTDSYVFLPKEFRGRLQEDVRVPSTTIYTAAWGRTGHVDQTPGWSSDGWYSADGRIEIDYSRFYHSSGDTPENTTDRQPWRMAWAARAGGLALLRLAW